MERFTILSDRDHLLRILHILLDVTSGPAGEIFPVLFVCKHIANGHSVLCFNTFYLTPCCGRGGDCKGLQNKPCFINIGD